MPIVRSRRIIDNDGAATVLAAAEQKARETGARVVLAVVDPWGELVELRRTPGAQVASSRVAVDKARTAAIFGRPSREMEEQVTNGRIGALALHGASCLTGGIPLKVGDEVIGAIELVTDELDGPNGIAFSPDERHLYVGNWPTDPSHAKVVMRYELDGDGRPVGAGEVLHDMTAAPGEDAIDGIKVDVDGNLYVCGPAGIWVLSPDGDELGLVRLPEAPHNLAWGDDDRRSLYVTALTSVYRLRLGVRGVAP